MADLLRNLERIAGLLLVGDCLLACVLVVLVFGLARPRRRKE